MSRTPFECETCKKCFIKQQMIFRQGLRYCKNCFRELAGMSKIYPVKQNDDDNIKH